MEDLDEDEMKMMIAEEIRRKMRRAMKKLKSQGPLEKVEVTTTTTTNVICERTRKKPLKASKMRGAGLLTGFKSVKAQLFNGKYK